MEELVWGKGYGNLKKWRINHLTIRPLDYEFMLQHYQISFSGLETHQFLKLCAERV